MNIANALYGLGCDCIRKSIAQEKFDQLNGVNDYDQIKVGGKTYTVNQIIDKTITAATATKLYSGPRSNATVVGTVKAGQQIGVVFSYIRPDQADGKSWLMFESSYTPGTAAKVYYVPNEVASGSGLKEQGTLTVDEEMKKEQEELEKQNEPVTYYFKKIGIPVLLIVGGILVVKSVAPQLIDKIIPSKKPATA